MFVPGARHIRRGLRPHHEHCAFPLARRSPSFALHRGNADRIVQGVRNPAPAAAAVVHDGGKARRPGP